MSKAIRMLLTVMMVMILLVLSGCDDPEGQGGGGTGGGNEDDPNDPRTFIFADSNQFPYEKKEDCVILDKQPNTPHTVYIYLINNGGSWKDNEVKNIKISYYDLSRGTITTIPQNNIHLLKYGKHDLTYIRVDNVSYPLNARGYFGIEAEVEQGNKKWYKKNVFSNQFNYGTPPPPTPPPITKDQIIYEYRKEVKQ